MPRLKNVYLNDDEQGVQSQVGTPVLLWCRPPLHTAVEIALRPAGRKAAVHRVPPAASLSVASRHLAGKILSYLESDVEVYSGEEAHDLTTTTTSVMDFIEEVRRPVCAACTAMRASPRVRLCDCDTWYRSTTPRLARSWRVGCSLGTAGARTGRERTRALPPRTQQGSSTLLLLSPDR